MIKEPKLQAVTVAMGFDDAYLPHTAAVIASIVQRGNAGDFRFLMLNTGIPKPRQIQVESIAPGAAFQWIEVGAEHLPELKVKGAIAHVNRATFLRLALERLAPADCDRVIYLDSDLIVPGDLRQLWKVDLGGAVVAGAHDQFVRPEEFAQRWSLPPADIGYFNAGVLLIDLKQVRQEQLFSRAMSFVLENNPPYADQDALNWALWNRWREVEPVWNVGRHMVIPALIPKLGESRRLNGRRPAIIHFTGPEKPWLRAGYHPWSWLYWQALRKTPFEAEVSNREGVHGLAKLRLWLRWQRRRHA